MSKAIRDSIKKMSGTDQLRQQLKNTVCTVTSVDAEKAVCNCQPVDGDAAYLNVRLRSSLNGSIKGLVMLPAVGSEVIVASIGESNAAAYVTAYSDIDQVWIENTGGMSFKIKQTSIELNGSAYSLIKDDVLKQELEKVNALLSAMMAILNGASIPEPGNGSSSALQIALKAAIAGKTLPTYNSITNPKVKHG